MQIEKQSTKFIKPDTPTPSTLSHYTLGFIDENAPALNVNIVLFFSRVSNLNSNFVSLEKSLEKTLTRFYPLAGRYLEEKHVVDCKDQGAEFTHAKVNIKLEDINLGDSEVNLSLVDEFIPSAIGAVDQVTDPILSVQVCTFDCGGVALGVSISHRVADASTLCTFLNEWASISRGENQLEFTGSGFNSSLFFPPRGIRPGVHGLPRSRINNVQKNYVTMKLSFNDNEISKLREKMLNGRNESQQYLSKVQIVLAFIWKAFMESDRRTDASQRKFYFLWPISLRGRIGSLIPKDCCGNFSSALVTECNIVETTTQELGDLLRDTLQNFMNEIEKVCHDNEQMQTMIMNSLSQVHTLPPTSHKVVLSSWCKFPFYKADFGFGKPDWVNRGNALGKNMGHLMDGVGGNGIEAYVGIEKEQIPYFEEIKASAA